MNRATTIAKQALQLHNNIRESFFVVFIH